jgi:cation-transporting ATPase E
LLILGAVLVLFGSAVEGIITSGTLLVNVVIAAVQEVRAKQKLDEIALLGRPLATVIRDGQQLTLDPGEIVRDDLILIGPGDQFVVDGELVTREHLGVDESLLTGESRLVAKHAGDRVLSGSFCVTGRGVYRATRVGINSVANKLTLEARIFTRHRTPLQREVNLIIRILLALIFFFAILLLIDHTMHGVPPLESVRSASVLFGLAPSSLFLMIVVSYALGAVRIASRGALVQQANSVESLCNVDILCLDKTGTLTTNHINLEEVEPLVGRRAYETEAMTIAALRRLLGDFSRSAQVNNRTGEAIRQACEGQARHVQEEVPFTSQQGWSGLVFDDPELTGTYVLGGPELLESRLAAGSDLGSKPELWRDQGRRVLLFAYQPQKLPLHDGDDEPQLPESLEPLCLLSFSDELRPQVQDTLRGFAEAGIKLKFISGDNPETVAALVRQAGFLQNDQQLGVVSGLELAKMDDAQLAVTAVEASVFGRITPQQKELIIKTLRAQEHYVAMTGDGVNDVLALKRANLGIAMQSGSRAARSVADIVLLDDSFAALPEAFKEGQRILNGIQDILRLYMSRILYLAFLVAAIGFVGGGFPFTPRQNAIISVITLSIPALCLAMWAKPGPTPRVSLTTRLAHFVIPAVISVGVVGLAVYLYYLQVTGDMFYAQTTLTYTAILCGILLLVFVEPPTRWWVGGDLYSGDRRPTLLAGGLVLLFVLFLAVPPLRDFYGLIPLRAGGDYISIFLAVACWMLVLRMAWRARLVDRYLNVSLSRASGFTDEKR